MFANPQTFYLVRRSLDDYDGAMKHIADTMKTVVVMPTYNEAKNLPGIVAELMALGLHGLEVVIVDDNSQDGTGHIADRLAEEYPGQVHVIHRPGKLGLGTAYKQGFRYALDHGASLVIEMDADFSHSPADLPQMIEKAREYDVVVGSRYVPGGGVDEQWGPWRRFLSRFGNIYVRLMTGLQVRDTTAGFKVFRREVLENLDLSHIRSHGYTFMIEMAYACQQAGYRVCEVPIFFNDRVVGNSKMDLSIMWEAVWRVWQMRFQHRR